MSYNNKKNFFTGNILSDEWYTPIELVKFCESLVSENKNVICPFDTENSNFVKVFKDCQYGMSNFLENTYDYDICITNPPFSLKEKVLEKCLIDNKEFILVLPQTFIFSVTFYNLTRNYNFNYKIYSPKQRIYFIDEQGNQNRPNFHSILLHVNKDFKVNEIIHFDLESEE